MCQPVQWPYTLPLQTLLIKTNVCENSKKTCVETYIGEGIQVGTVAMTQDLFKQLLHNLAATSVDIFADNC